MGTRTVRRPLPGEQPGRSEGETPRDIENVKAYYHIDDFSYRSWSENQLKDIRVEAANTIVDTLDGVDEGGAMSGKTRPAKANSAVIEWQLADDLRDGPLPLFERMPSLSPLLVQLSRGGLRAALVQSAKEDNAAVVALPELREATEEVPDASAEVTATYATESESGTGTSARDRLRALARKGVSDG